MKPAWFSLIGLLAACTSLGPSDPAGNTADPALAAVCRDAWEHALRFDPLFATRLGDARYHGALVLPGPATDAARAAEVGELLLRTRAIDPAALGGADRVTWEVLLADLEQTERELAADLSPSTYNLDPLEGPQATFLSLAEDQPVATAREREQCLERWRRIPGYLDAVRRNLEQGLAEGRVASWTATHKVLAQLDQLLATPPEESALCAKLAGAGSASFRRELLAVVGGEIYPAYARLRHTISERILPHARDDQHPGIGHVPGGRELYALLVRRETSLELGPAEIHAIGLAEVARIRERDRAARRARLRHARRGRDPAPPARRSRAALHDARGGRSQGAALARARQRGRAGGLRPPARARPASVVRVPEHEERDTTIAYYREPRRPTGAAPGRYFINTYAPDDAPALRGRGAGLPRGRSRPPPADRAGARSSKACRTSAATRGSTAFVEGWALYTERLCDELGLYTRRPRPPRRCSPSTPGAPAAWWSTPACTRSAGRASRPSTTWSRTRCSRRTTSRTRSTATSPGPARRWPTSSASARSSRCAREAEAALGERFDLAAFHDRVLENGAVSLGVLRAIVAEWIAAEQARAPGGAGHTP